MCLHKHTYPPYIPETATCLIVGILPPPRFSSGELNDQDVDFCYGSKWDALEDLGSLVRSKTSI